MIQKTMTALLCVLILVANTNIALSRENSNWTMICSNPQRSNSTNKKLASRYQISESIDTKAKSIQLSPIMANDRIFLSLSSDYRCIGSATYFVSFDANTLEQIKKEEFYDLFWYEYSFKDNSIFTQLFGRFVSFSSETFEIEWEHKTSEQNRGNHVLFDDRIVFVDDDEKYVCIDTNTGETLWETIFPFSCCYLTYNKGRIFTVVGDSIGCINSENGAIVWENKIEDFEYRKSMILTEEYILLSDLNQTICLDQTDGREIYRKQDFYIDSYLDGVVYGTAIVDEEYYLSAFDLETSETIWTGGTPHVQVLNYSCCVNDVLSSQSNILYVPVIQTNNEEYTNYFTVCDADIGSIKQMLEFDVDATFFAPIPYDDYIFLITNSAGRNENIWLFKLSPASNSLSFQISSNKYTPDNDSPVEMDTTPTIQNGRTLLPARYVCEPLGGQVFWNGDERKVTCKLVAPDNHLTEEYKENIVELWINKPTAKINGKEVQIDPDNPDVVPTIINDRTMVPMRFLAESLGCEVEWVAETKEIILTYPNE